jgi:protocatechuate 3,4-dioxygenase beta subunit
VRRSKETLFCAFALKGKHMNESELAWRTRRDFLRACLALPAAAFVLAACSGQAADSATPQAAAPTQPAPTNLSPTQAPPTPTQPTPASPPPTQAPLVQAAPTQLAPAQVLQPTPACADDDGVTPAQTEGPYFTPNSPERTSLLDTGIAGTKLTVTGYILTTDCKPIARALLDFWQADDKGVYDNNGFRLRGHQFSDDTGRYSLETIVPGLYPGRTRHIHVKVQLPNQSILTSQLYFPGEPGNQSDSIFNQNLLLVVQDASDGKLATFNFVL